MRNIFKSLAGSSAAAERDEVEQYVRILRFLVATLLGGGVVTGLTAAGPTQAPAIPTWAVEVREDIAAIKSTIGSIKEDVNELKRGR